MGSFFKIIGDYITALLHEVVFLAAGLFGLLYQIAGVIWPNVPFTDIKYFLSYLLIVYVVASIRIWNKERKKHLNPIKYSLTFTLRRFENERYVSQFTTTEQRKSALQIIQDWQEWGKDPVLAARYAKIYPTKNDCEKYLDDLDKYEQKLREFQEKTTNCYFVDFVIKNESNFYDEGVIVEIAFKDNEGRQHEFFWDLDDVMKFPELPNLWKTIKPDSNISPLKKLLEKPKKTERHPVMSAFGSRVYSEIKDMYSGAVEGVLGNARGECILKSAADDIEIVFSVNSKKATDWFKGKTTIKTSEAKPMLYDEW